LPPLFSFGLLGAFEVLEFGVERAVAIDNPRSLKISLIF
jgi:hypothetical protein